jgi:hypothetical protein
MQMEFLYIFYYSSCGNLHVVLVFCTILKLHGSKYNLCCYFYLSLWA